VLNGLKRVDTFNNMNTKAVFEALPHVNTIWVVDETFHLHPNYGGEKVERFKTIDINSINIEYKPISKEVVEQQLIEAITEVVNETSVEAETAEAPTNEVKKPYNNVKKKKNGKR